MWVAQLDRFSANFRVIVPDLHGFGQSDAPEPGELLGMEHQADLLAALLDQLGIDEPIVLIGLSMGGYIAMQFVQKYANRLQGLVLADTRAQADPPEVAESRRKLAVSIDAPTRSGLAAGMLPKLFAEKSLETMPERVASIRRMIESIDPTGIAGAALGMADRPDTTELLARITVPTLVIVGEHDIPSPAVEMQGIADAIPNATFVKIPDAGHMTPVEQPELFNAALQRFLETM